MSLTGLAVWLDLDMRTSFQRAFAPIKQFLPTRVSNFLRSAVTAFITPAYTFYRKGHFRSSFAMVAVDRHGSPLPWYTYPCIDFLRFREFSGKRILEFGAGHSTIWWASVAQSVLALEGQQEWVAELARRVPSNVTLCLVDLSSVSACLRDARDAIREKGQPKYDIVVIDGLYRKEVVPIAIEALAPNGAIICDNAEGYEIYEAFAASQFKRIDFYGNAPGVSLQHCTSVFFQNDCFLLQSASPIGKLNGE
jgi:hypothetical protein